jgi:hypothetical protein
MPVHAGVFGVKTVAERLKPDEAVAFRNNV